MATYSNPLPMTQVPIRRSFNSPQRGGDPYASNRDESGYRVRSEDELSKVELLSLSTVEGDSTTKKLMKFEFATLFEGLKAQLETWPMFFHSKEESGMEMQQAFVTLWSNFLIAETLLASISIQPLVTVPDMAHGWKFQLYGYIWMMSVISDFWGIAITAVFLGYLLGCPNKVGWNWMCEIGWLRSIPSLLVLLDAILSLVAIAYSCWVLYGYQMGIVCAVVELLFVGSCLKLADTLDRVGRKITNKKMQ